MAEWWKRLVAVIIDGVILGVPVAIAYGILIAALDTTDSIDPITGELEEGAEIFGGAFLIVWALSILVPFLYFTLLNGSVRGQTVGKRIMKIQVRDANSGGPIGAGRAFVRYLVNWLLFAACTVPGIVDGLWPLWDQRRQALHDKAANSLVVDAA